LLGFWTYELRVAHAGTGTPNWSTAQARYGRPLRVTGVQHPAPSLKCMVSRGTQGVKAISTFATPVLNGRKFLGLGQPFTELWVLLYAQVTQADGASQRNVLLLTERADPLPDQLPDPNGGTGPSVTRDVSGVAVFSQKDDLTILNEIGIETALSNLLLPLNSPLSVLAVELLPSNGGFDRPTVDPASGTPQDPQGIGPLDISLGKQRILRTSPLTAVPGIC
jgi:hypothetical protein